jgi:hypothetical protein
MTQESLGAGCAMRPVDKAYRRLVLAVSDAVEAVGLGIAAGRCGLRPQDLSDMLAGHKGRRLPTDVAAVVADMVTGELRQAIQDAIKEMFGMHQPDDDATYIRKLEDGYAWFGPGGSDKLDKIRRAARRG